MTYLSISNTIKQTRFYIIDKKGQGATGLGMCNTSKILQYFFHGDCISQYKIHTQFYIVTSSGEESDIIDQEDENKDVTYTHTRISDGKAERFLASNWNIRKI